MRSFFLRMYQTVDLATPNVSAISDRFVLIFQPNDGLLPDCDSSLDFILRVDSNGFQTQIPYLRLTLDLVSAPCQLNNELPL